MQRPLNVKNVKQFCLREFRKIRHRKGYGVHSPFAYGLITKVIEEKSGYYAYQQIEELHRLLHDKQDFSKRKGRLLFRLANRFKPQCIVECGTGGGYATLYLQKGCPSARHFCIEPDPIARAAAEQLLMRLPGKATYLNLPMQAGLDFLHAQGEQPHLIYVHAQPDAGQCQITLEHIAPLLNDKSIIIIDGIRKGKSIHRCWEKFLTQNPQIRATFDLCNMGIAICYPKLNRQNYIVAF